jgi:hypothetical protein
MNKVPGMAWWSTMGLFKPQAEADTDYADMGTAFGLDASLAPFDLPAPDTPGEAVVPVDRLNRRSVL